MTRNQLISKPVQLAGVIPLLFLNFAFYPQELNAQLPPSINSNKQVNSGRNQLAQLKFPDNGTPKGRRRGGTSRDECPNLTKPITALVPGQETAADSKSFLASTVSEYPTFWVYIPELPTNLRSGEFVLQNEEGNDIYRTPQVLSGKSGIISISLPSNPQYALKIGKKYHWYFRVYCNEAAKSPYFYVDAWVERVPLTQKLESQLKATKPREYIAYADNQIWQDAITNLAQLRPSNSSDKSLNEDWTNLLKSVGLEDLSGEGIVGNR
jgi:hypothetical protein